jgi:cytochrome c556
MKSHVLMLVALAPAAALSADDPANVVKYREQVMESLGKHMKATSMISKGEIVRPKEDLVLHARAMHDVSGVLLSLFPPGTGPTEVKATEAKADVWTRWKEFEAANAKFATESKKLLDLAEAGDVVGFKAQSAAVGKSCGGCHDTFRVEDE